MSDAERDVGSSDEDRTPQKAVAKRFADAGLEADRFIDVRDGEKASVDHDTRFSDPRDVPGSNYGIYAEPTDRVVLLDIDEYDGEIPEPIAGLGDTLTQRSPHGGEHRVYAVEPSDDGRLVAALLDDEFGAKNPAPSWGEVRAANQYVVGAGSQLDGCDKDWCEDCATDDGGRYRIDADRPVATIDASALVDALRQDPDLSPTDTGGGDARAHTERVDTADSDGYEPAGTPFEDVVEADTTVAMYLGTGPKAAEFTSNGDGDRSAADYYVVCRAIEHGVPEVEVRERLADCPYSKVGAPDSARNYWSQTWSNALRSDVEPNSAVSEVGSAAGLSPSAVEAWFQLGEDGSIADLSDRQKAAATWDLLKRGDESHVRVRRDNSSLWAFEGGVWEPGGERALRHAARKALGAENYGNNTLTELKAQARSDPDVEIDADGFGLAPGYVAVENGLVDLEAAAEGAGMDAIRGLEPEDHALAQLPVEYDPSAGYDEWEAYVEEWAEDGRADALQEYVGYCLHVGAMPIHRALLLVGSGANGKGTFLSVVRALLGRENTSSIELQTLANERDAVADFYGSLANIDDDLSARKLGAGLGMFKKLVGGDRVRARRLYEDGFEFDATGKHLYAANEVPDVEVPDDDEAFWRRWLLVEFPNHYPQTDRDTDKTLRDRLTEPETLSGVLNWAIEGWSRLLDQGHFTGEERYAHAKRERWQAWGDSVDQFISECVERDPDAPNRSTGEVYARYQAWCRENGERPAGQQQLTTSLKTENVDYAKRVRPRGKGTPTNGYKSVGFSDGVPEDTDDDGGDGGGDGGKQVSLT